MGNNVRRISKQKWIDNEKILKRRVFNDQIEYYTKDENGISVMNRDQLTESYLTMNKNNEKSKPWNFNPNSFRNSQENFVYKNLKKHEIDCLANNFKFCGFVDKRRKMYGNVHLAKCNRQNVPYKLKQQIDNGQILCNVEPLTTYESQIEIRKNRFLKKINECLFQLVNEYVKLYETNNLSKMKPFILKFDENLTKYIKNNKVNSIYDQLTFSAEMDTKLKKTISNGKTKVNNNYLHMYYYELLFNNEASDLVAKYEREIYNTIKWFKNRRHELNKRLACCDGEYKQSTPQRMTIKKRIYGSTNQFNVKKMYQKAETNERMSRLYHLKESNLLNDVVVEIIEIFQLANLRETIVCNTNVCDELSVKNIISLQKDHYKKAIVPQVEKTQLFKELGDEKRQLMRMFNVYLKGRYNKTCKEFKNKNLTNEYLNDIYNPEKIARKFKVSLVNKLNLYFLSAVELRTIRNSEDLEYKKMLQTYNVKLMDKLDYCSRLPIANGRRISDVFSEKINIESFQFSADDLLYEVEYFPVLKVGEGREKFKNSLNNLYKFRNEVNHNNFTLDTLKIEFCEAQQDISYLNSKIADLLDSKLKYNNVYKFFDANQLNNLYRKISTDEDLDFFTYNVSLPKFSKVFTQLYYHNTGFDWLNEFKVIYRDDQERIGALEYLLQTIYYLGFGSSDIKFSGQTIEDYMIEMQRICSLKKDSRSENQKLIDLVKTKFQTYLEDINVDKLIMSKAESKDIGSAFDGINILKSSYTIHNTLLNLSFYLDSKRLSGLIYDTKKLVHGLEAIGRLNNVDKEILQSNIAMLGLLLQYKDRLKNINCDQKIADCVLALETKDRHDNFDLFVFNSEKMHDDNIKRIKQFYENKKEEYAKLLSLMQDKVNVKHSYLDISGQEQGIYESCGKLINYSGLEHYQKNDAITMLERLLEFDNALKISDSNIENYELLAKSIKQIEAKENQFFDKFNTTIKNIESVLLKKQYIEELKSRPEYEKIKNNNKLKNEYHYLSNKIKFNHMKYINSFIDDILVGMNTLMQYWERDANLVIDKYFLDNPEIAISSTEKVMGKHGIYRKNYLLGEYKHELDKLLINHVNYKYKDISALDIKNYVSDNNYYSLQQNNCLYNYSLLELMNIIHDIMGYNLKYQKSVINVFNKILLKYKIGNQTNSKNELPLKYSNGKIVINAKFFAPRTHSQFNEIKLNSTEYVEHIKKILIFKNS